LPLEDEMGKGRTVAIAVTCLLVGISVGYWFAIGPIDEVLPQTNRFEVHREGDLLLIRATQSNGCFLSLKGEGIVAVHPELCYAGKQWQPAVLSLR
jgi:hypothetical protein